MNADDGQSNAEDARRPPVTFEAEHESWLLQQLNDRGDLLQRLDAYCHTYARDAQFSHVAKRESTDGGWRCRVVILYENCQVTGCGTPDVCHQEQLGATVTFDGQELHVELDPNWNLGGDFS